ncbi:glycosyltransferase family 4 protein [Hymenobacter weizhouensis]|uniref:glycosyltransferase family 4 protein n=1 Tax=Hymenobacter sp. YIM 151500-1 TaxID=2987689 RepID=UPI0022270863|nr:glycosyltransferase [Hymenobacter sp. YIM 151500-1]UYZ63413.1 glycosyltransferase [Hymenobacter sp. YIM 151500-1]
MISAPVPVLLLGWNGASPLAGGAPAAHLPELLRGLTSRAALTVLLPHAAPALAATGIWATAVFSFPPSDLPTPARPARPAGWQHPAAPYQGADAAAQAPGTRPGRAVPAAPYLGSTPAPVAASSTGENAEAGPGFSAASPADDAEQGEPTTAAALATLAAPAAELLLNEDDFATPAEPAATEAHALSQPADDLVPDAPTAAEPVPAVPAALAAELSPDADLNRQVIQYARLATRRALAEEFAVIYATEWPTWLAALEIRQQTGRPLALHVHSLAQDRPTPADRGWGQELERLALRRADLVLASSEELAQRLRATYPLPPHRLRVAAATDAEAVHAALQRLESSFAGR